jgi:hypothetical protein
MHVAWLRALTNEPLWVKLGKAHREQISSANLSTADIPSHRPFTGTAALKVDLYLHQQGIDTTSGKEMFLR